MTTAHAEPLTPQLSQAFAQCRAYMQAYPAEHDFTAEEVHLPRRVLSELEARWYLKASEWRSRSHYGFKLADTPGIPEPWVIAALEAEEQERVEEYTRVPQDMFRHIVGYEFEKGRMFDALSHYIRVHFGLFGPPASAKSMVLDAVKQALPDSEWVQGGNATRAGINVVLAGKDPPAILVDEADKLRPDDWVALSDIMDRGVLQVTQGNIRLLEPKRGLVFVAGNDASVLPPHVRSRMIKLIFGSYTKHDFVAVCEAVLVEQLELERAFARETAEWCWAKNVRDVREVRSIAQICPDLETLLMFLDSPHRLREEDIERMRMERRRR